MNILFISPRLIYPQDSGGKKSIVGRILVDYKDHDVDLVQINLKGNDSSRAEEFFRNKGIKCSTITSFYSPFRKRDRYFILYFISLFSMKAKYVQDFDNYFLKRKISKKISFDSYDLIICEHIYLASIIPDEYKTRVKIVIHNIEHNLMYDRSLITANIFRKMAYYHEYRRLKVYEKRVLADTKLQFIFLSDIDRRDFESIYNLSITNYEIASNQLFQEGRIQRTELENFILFTGNLWFEPNFHGLNWFLENCSEKILNKYPALEIVITGDNSRQSKFSKYKNLRFTAYIDNDEMNELFSKCILMISPILMGSGIKIKNLEAKQLGIPLVMTKSSAKGFPEYNDLTDDPDDFTQRTLELIEAALQTHAVQFPNGIKE